MLIDADSLCEGKCMLMMAHLIILTIPASTNIAHYLYDQLSTTYSAWLMSCMWIALHTSRNSLITKACKRSLQCIQ